jgi:hypothetical protein
MHLLKTLATVRRLAAPVMQINVARQQVNVAGSPTLEREFATSVRVGFGPARSLALSAWLRQSRKVIKEGRVVPFDRSGGEEAAVTPTAGPDFARRRRRLAPPK